MKNRLFSMTAAAIALLSSCEEMVQQEILYEVLPAEEQTVFTANLGVDTKTYLEYEEGVYKTRWEAGDDIFILATNSDGTYWYEHAEIIEGTGTSTGKFAATANLKGEKYHAYYGYNSYFNGEGKFSPQLPEYQYRPGHYDENGDWVGDNNVYGYYFPMFAESTTTSFSFQNLCAILKVDLVGTDYVENVIFTPNDPTVPVAGGTDLSFVDGEPVLAFVDSTAIHRVCFYVQEVLDPAEPASCYISIPAQTYPGGFTLTINSASGSMTVETTEDVVFERSQIRSVPTITYENQVTNTWGLCGVMTDWNTDIPMTLEEQYFVLEDQYLEAGQEFKFRANGDWTVNYGYTGQAINPDTGVELTANGPNMYMTSAAAMPRSLRFRTTRLFWFRVMSLLHTVADL